MSARQLERTPERRAWDAEHAPNAGVAEQKTGHKAFHASIMTDHQWRRNRAWAEKE